MTALESKILREIQTFHQGPLEAIRAETLARRFETNKRQIEDAVHNLIVKYHAPLATSRGKPPGVYWARSADEAESCVKMLVSTETRVRQRRVGLEIAISKQESGQGRRLF